MNCKRCGTQLREEGSYCHECGQSKEGKLLCPHCGAELEAGYKFCHECGKSAIYNSTNNTTNVSVIKEEPKYEYVEEKEPIKNIFEDINVENNINESSTDISTKLKNNKSKLVAAILVFIQMLLFNAEIITSKVMGMSADASLLETLDMESTVFIIFGIITMILFIAFIFKEIIGSKYLYLAPIFTNLIYPVAVGINIIKMLNQYNQTSSAVSGLTGGLVDMGGLTSSLGISIAPNFLGIVLVVIIIVVEVIAIKEFKKINSKY